MYLPILANKALLYSSIYLTKFSNYLKQKSTMKNAQIRLADLNESNINQLVASDMLMILGGGGKKGYKKGYKKGSKKSGSRSGSRNGGGHGCRRRYCGCGW